MGYSSLGIDTALKRLRKLVVAVEILFEKSKEIA